MNIRSGLFGAWLCFLIAWIAYCAWNSDIACLLERIGVHTSPGVWCKVQNAHYYGNFVLKMVGIWGGVAPAWIFQIETFLKWELWWDFSTTIA